MDIIELREDVEEERVYADFFAASYERRKVELLAASNKFKNNQTKQNYDLCRKAYSWAKEGYFNAIASWMNVDDLKKEFFEKTGESIFSTEKPRELEEQKNYYFLPKSWAE